MRKARKIINILSGQKPKKKRKNLKKGFVCRLLWLALLPSIAAIAIIFVNKKESWKFKWNVPTSPSPKIYEVYFTPFSDKRLTSDSLNIVSQIVNEHLNATRHSDLSLLAKKIQNQFYARGVNINKTSTTKIAVTMKLRDPVMLVKSDKIHFVDEECAVYGEINGNEMISDLPILHDVFSDHDARLRLNDTAIYQITAEQRKIICDAIDLSRLSREKGLDFSEFHFIKYRGFLARTKQGDCEIILGFAPFNKRIDRLTEILLNLKKEGVTAARIELDYDNKAFVKEKSSETQRSL